MILRTWSGALVDTAAHGRAIWLRWACGWLLYIAHGELPRRCQSLGPGRLRCWERYGHKGDHRHERPFHEYRWKVRW